MILAGRKETLESLDQFRERFDVSWQEIFESLDHDSMVEVLREIDKLEGAEFDIDDFNMDDPPEFRDDVLRAIITPTHGTDTLIYNVLEERDGVYTHTRNGCQHHIIEVTTPVEIKNRPDRKQDM